MRFLSQLLKRFQPLKVNDEFFGHLVYIEMPKNKVPYWEAKRQFSSQGVVELFIDAPGDEQAPTHKQRDFFIWAEQNYSEIVANVESVLRPYFEKWTRQPLSKHFEEEFSLTGFSIPLPTGNEPSKWEMMFESHSDANHIFTVTLLGSKAQPNVTIDG